MQQVCLRSKTHPRNRTSYHGLRRFRRQIQKPQTKTGRHRLLNTKKRQAEGDQVKPMGTWQTVIQKGTEQTDFFCLHDTQPKHIYLLMWAITASMSNIHKDNGITGRAMLNACQRNSVTVPRLPCSVRAWRLSAHHRFPPIVFRE